MQNRQPSRMATLLLPFVAVTLLTLTTPESVVGGSSPVAGVLGGQDESQSPWIVRAYYDDRQMVNALAAWLEPWEVHHDKGYLVVAANHDQIQRMMAAGFEIETDWALTSELGEPHARLPGQVSGIPSYPCYRTVEELYEAAQSLAGTYPHLASWIDIGDSWDKTEPGGLPGYDLMVLRLTNSSILGSKPKLFVMASVHGREYATSELATRWAEYLLSSYGTDPDVTWLLDHQEFHLLIVANPDGRKQAETGWYWRKNTNRDYCSPTSMDRGADLNRNFAFQWGCCGGSSGWECEVTFRGPTGSSEPETQAIENYVRSQFPDERGNDLSDPASAETAGIFLDLHSYGQLILWPWGFSSAPAPNGPALQTLGRKLANYNDYWPEQAIGLYPTDGTSDSFAYGELGLPAYTFELGTRFFEACNSFEETIVPENLPALLYAAKVARTPYQTPAGPDVLELAVSAGPEPDAQSFLLTAVIDDTGYSQVNGQEPTQAIAAAEFYVDIPPWSTASTTTAYAMAATDAAFDEEQEAVEAILDASGLTVTRHILFVRGQDADGNWGAFSAIFLHLEPPPDTVLYLPIIVHTP